MFDEMKLKQDIYWNCSNNRMVGLAASHDGIEFWPRMKSLLYSGKSLMQLDTSSPEEASGDEYSGDDASETLEIQNTYDDENEQSAHFLSTGRVFF